MIKLTKNRKPNILKINEIVWKDSLLQNIGNETEFKKIQKKYRHPEIKEAVISETNGKCCYCESKVTHCYHGDIEHIIPKSVAPEKTFEWENLTYVCANCNNKKRDYYSDTLSMLNPYVDEINHHIKAFGPMIMHINSSKRGEITIKKSGLNRLPLIEKRTETIKSIQTLIDKYNNETDISLREILEEEIIDFISNDQEYSMCLKCYCEAQGINYATQHTV